MGVPKRDNADPGRMGEGLTGQGASMVGLAHALSEEVGPQHSLGWVSLWHSSSLSPCQLWPSKGEERIVQEEKSQKCVLPGPVM